MTGFNLAARHGVFQYISAGVTKTVDLLAVVGVVPGPNCLMTAQWLDILDFPSVCPG